MDVLRRVFGDWRCFPSHFLFGQKKCKAKPSAFNKYEYYVYKFQSIVVWEHPTQTVSCLLLIQLLFWMIVNLCWKFYGIIFTLLLVFCTHDVWTEKIWPEIRLPQPDAVSYEENLQTNPRILTVAQIEEYFNNLLFHAKMTLIRFRNLRNSHPTMFCSIFSACFGLLTIIGCAISGIWLLYMVVMTLFLSPGVYIFILSESSKTSLKQYFNEFAACISSFGNAQSDEDDEYVPNLSDEKLEEAYATVFQLNDASNDFLSLDKDDLPSEGALPSFDDSSLDEMDRFAKTNLEFLNRSSVSSDTSSSSSSSGKIKFRGAHFDGSDGEFSGVDELDASSEEDDETAFLPDLQHRRKASVSDPSALSALVSGLTFSNLNQLSKNWFPNVMPSSSTSKSTRQRQEKTSNNTDDEFEFINESDLN